MITEALMTFLVLIVELITGLLPTTAAPSWMADGGGYLATVFSAGAGLGAWLPWPLIGTVFAAVMSCLLAGLTIKLVRIVASFFTAGGGSAA